MKLAALLPRMTPLTLWSQHCEKKTPFPSLPSAFDPFLLELQLQLERRYFKPRQFVILLNLMDSCRRSSSSKYSESTLR